uniref:Testis-expressed protein 2 n=1 Tax=Oryzias sinensis TaxID=183150 RepID=A0A8C7YTH3_9TELE
MEESKLIFSLDRKNEGPSVAFKKDKPQTRECQSDHSLEMALDLGPSFYSKPLFPPHSPSSPGSLSDLSMMSEDLLMTTGLVKSSSTDLNTSESSTLRGKPLLSLVKSFSTEISHRTEPEVNLSMSDSKLHLHPWKTNQKIPDGRLEEAGGDQNEDGSSHPSADNLSSTEPRGSSLIADLEDTRRKFSEAMQDPLSMLSKIMGDESSGSPKQGKMSAPEDSPLSQSCCRRSSISDNSVLRCRGTDSEHKLMCDNPVRRLQKESPIKSSNSLEQCSQRKDRHLEICSYGDVIQVVELQDGAGRTHQRTYPKSGVTIMGSAFPFHWLFAVGLLAYAFFVLPLPPYVTGLSLGVACGFMLGLVVVFVFSPRHGGSRGKTGPRSHTITEDLDRELTDPGFLEGWMSESFSYDPETFHPSITHSVYVTLDGSRLRLAYPRANIPRWASFEETHHEAAFLHAHIYQLANSKVSLEPPGLARKRIWNRKYPICITLAEGEIGEETFDEGQEEAEKAEKHTIPSQSSPVTLYLFGRTGREKEEWFQHLLLASKAGAVSSNEENTETPNSGEAFKENAEDLNDLSIKSRMMLDYTTYMTQLIGSKRCSPALSPCQSDKGSPSICKKVKKKKF